MIDFEFKTEYNPITHKYKVTVDDMFKYLLKKPLKVVFYNLNGVGWETELKSGMWNEWIGGYQPRWNIRIEDYSGNIIFDKKYNSIFDGSILDKSFIWFNKINKNTKGIVIGSHDGTWGHWVQSVLDNETEAIIIEGSENQYNQLKKNYGHLENVTCLNKIITTNGEDVVWYTGGEGFTDSILKEVPKIYLNDNDIKEERRTSYPINRLIEDYNYQSYDWLHTDIEGYDCELIMSLKYLPKLIIFENEHSKNLNTYDLCIKFLEENDFFIHDDGTDTMAIKK